MIEATVTDLNRVRTTRTPLALALPMTAATAPPTGTVTFWLTDIVDSTPLWESEPQAMATEVSRHYEILDAAVRRHGGVRPIEQGEGDSMVAVFAHACAAAAAAVDAQRELTAQDWSTSRPIEVRMALHAGEARLRDEMYYAGPTIIRCARLRALAHGGQILASASAAVLMREDPSIAVRTLGVHALKGLTVPEEVFALEHPDLPGAFPPPPPGPAPSTLPVAVTSFVGRLTELVELIELANTARCVSIVGAGGCGKTRLAAAVAASLVEQVPDGVWWVELAEVDDPDRVPGAVLGALGVDARSGDPTQRLLDYLATRTALLVLDNCEQVSAAVGALVGALLARCPQLVVLATSRAPLQVRGERAWRIGPLALPGAFLGAAAAHVADVAGAESVQLFCERATAARHSFRLDESNCSVVAEICRALDGIPLALELAAARVATLPPERILHGLQDRFRLLTGAGPDVPARQATLAASVHWSHDLLDDAERTLLRRLAVFIGPFTLEAAEQIAADDQLDPWAVMSALAALVDKSLVTFDGERYGLLQTIREFAAERLIEAGEAERLRDAHLAHYRGVAAGSAIDLTAGPQIHTLVDLEQARANLLAAVDWALTRGDAESAAAIAGDLTLFWLLHGRHAESLACLRRTLAALPEEPSVLRARVLAGVGMLGVYGMDLPSGYGLVETAEAVEMATAVGSPQDLGRALGMAGFMAALTQPMHAFEPLAEARRAAIEAGDPYGRGISAVIAAIAATLGCSRPDLAEPHLAELAAHADATASPLWATWLNYVRGMEHWQAGRLIEAVRALTVADDLAWAIGEPTMESWCAVWLADALVDAGQLDDAERIIRRSAGWMERASYARLEFIESRLIGLALARGDLAEADRQLIVAEAICAEMGFDFAGLQCAIHRARWSVATGDLARAEAAVARGAGWAEELQMPWYSVGQADAAGRVARALGKPGAAEDAHHRALELCVRHGFAGVAAGTLEALGSLAAAGGSWAEAARLYGAADTLRRCTGQIRPLLDRADAAADLEAMHVALGRDEFAEATAEGADLDLAAAAAYAARARGERKRPASGWESLTPTELAVVELAAQGLTNAEIGQRLFTTAGTAKVHLHHIFNKLGVSRRAELAALATERRLTAESSA
ncbi:MAG TPA: LuxR C-terminal-related transcriptional regulator [Sporichthyaceae bacterium]